jgi:hypothetical protein
MRRLAGVVLALVLVAPAAASAQTELPVGEAHGVRMEVVHGGLVLTFTKPATKLFKRIAGREILVSCTTFGEEFDSVGGGNVDVPLHRRRFATGDEARDAAFCRLWLPPRTVKRHKMRVRFGRTLLVSVPLTQAGAVYLDEEAKTFSMLRIEFLVDAVKDKLKLSGYPTYDQIVQRVPQAPTVMAELTAPGDSPPPGKVGYYSDGNEHVTFARMSRSGRRLFIDYAADEVLTTNVAQYLFGERD